VRSRRLRIAACVPFPSAPHRPTAQPKIDPYRDPFLSSDSVVVGVPAVSGEDHGEEVARMARRGASAAAPGAVLARADRKGEDRERIEREAADWDEIQSSAASSRSQRPEPMPGRPRRPPRLAPPR